MGRNEKDTGGREEIPQKEKSPLPPSQHGAPHPTRFMKQKVHGLLFQEQWVRGLGDFTAWELRGIRTSRGEGEKWGPSLLKLENPLLGSLGERIKDGG